MAEETRYDGTDAATLARTLGLPRVELFDSVTSTLDVAHSSGAAGAPAGTLVLADRQTAGRGRHGRAWTSPAGAGIWLTLVERPTDRDALEVLSLRLGLRAAEALQTFAGDEVQLKWPNDLYVGGRKLAGILVEVRWRDDTPDWAAIGFGLNVRAPDGMPAATGLAAGVERLAVLRALVPALRAAAAATGRLTPDEISSFSKRDVARGRRLAQPAAGVARGIDRSGAYAVAGPHGVSVHRTGSLLFAEDT